MVTCNSLSGQTNDHQANLRQFHLLSGHSRQNTQFIQPPMTPLSGKVEINLWQNSGKVRVVLEQRQSKQQNSRKVSEQWQSSCRLVVNQWYSMLALRHCHSLRLIEEIFSADRSFFDEMGFEPKSHFNLCAMSSFKILQPPGLILQNQQDRQFEQVPLTFLSNNKFIGGLRFSV